MDFNFNTKITKLIKLSPRKHFLVLLPIIGLFLLPNISHAGVLDFISSIFSGTEASATADTVIESSSQNMILPEPANNIEPSLKVSGEVVIDGGEALLSEAGPSTDAPEAVDNSNGQISVYIVRSGDTLAEIATMFDVSVNTILWANDLSKGSALKVGQTLVILPISGVMHTVTSGDTLSSIAKKYSGDVAEIASFNDLKVSDKIAVGDTILIPDGQASTSIRPSSVSSRQNSNGTTRLLAGTANGPDLGSYFMKPFVGGTKTQGLHGYNSVDYGMPVGSPLYAAAPGTVIISKSSGWNGGYGNYVVIQHPNGTQTVYGHMSGPIVSVGQALVRGQLIGYSGNSGNSTGPHLHLEIRGAKNPF
jgi:murein DD-endopeptidase MepM/ murein hydrolase activator NlpD